MENKIVRFGELYQIPSSNGLSRPSAVRGIGFKMINMGELFANNIISDIPMERVQMSETEQKKFFVEQGDLLFARQSLVAEGAGKCSIVKFFNEPTTFESHLIRVRLNQKVANPWYYYYLFQLKSNPIKAIINQCAQAGIRGSELVRVKVPNPPLPTQQKIASILSAYDNLIQNYKKQIKALQTAASELYKEWFVRFRFPDYQSTKFENGIPEGWKKTKLNTLISFLNGYAFKSEEYEDIGKFKIITIKNVQDGFFDASNADYVNSIPNAMPEHCLLNKGDILMSLTGNVGRLCIVSENNCLLNQRVCKIQSRYPYYTYSFLKQDSVFQTICNIAYGTAQLNLSPILAGRLKIIVPTDELMKKFDNMVYPIFKKTQVLIEEITNLTQQRDLLLPRLMSGKLEV